MATQLVRFADLRCRLYASAEAWVANSENRFDRMSSPATRTAFVVRDPSVSNSRTIRVGSLPTLTESTLYCSANFLQVLQSDASSAVSSSSVAVDCMWLSQNGTSGSRASKALLPAFRSG